MTDDLLVFLILVLGIPLIYIGWQELKVVIKNYRNNKKGL